MPVVRITKTTIEKAAIPSSGTEYLWDASLKGFGVVLHAPSTLHPHGSRVFVQRYRTRTGKDRRQVLGRFGELTAEQARAMAQDVLADVRRGADPLAERRSDRANREQSEAETVTAVYERWHASRLRIGKWKKSTADDLDRMFRRDVLPMIGKIPIAEVSRRDVQRVLEAKADAPYVANRIRTWIGALLTHAEREELRPPGPNPCATIERNVEKARERALSLEELARFGAGLRAQQEEYATAVSVLQFLAMTGLRKREATRLTWPEVDLKAGALRLADSKTGARVKLLAEPALAILRRRAGEGKTPTTGWVFPSERKPKVPISELRDVIAAACKGADGKEGVAVFKVHALRHTFMTIAATKARLNPLLVGLMVGHAKRGVTEGYIHVDPDDALVREAEERVQTLIARALAGETADVIALDARRNG